MSELIDNGKRRIELLKTIIKGLHAGEDPAAVKDRLTHLVQAASAEEIMAMEQQLIAEGMSVEEIKGMCDLHAQVTSELLLEPPHAPVGPGHPVHTFRVENVAIAAVVAQTREALAADPIDVPRWRALHDQLLEVEKHYARKENILFAHLERHGIHGPSKVMWGKDDDIRALLRAVREALVADDADPAQWRAVADQLAAPLLEQVAGMIDKEEDILLPLALRKLTPAEWAEIRTDSARFGFCLVDAPTPAAGAGGEAPAAAAANGAIRVGTGSLTLAQLEAVFATLPVDLTLVDADDRVVFFSEGKSRVFDRASAIIGRQVQLCHPPQSVATVERILADFRGGAQDVAEFWIEMRDRFVHIRYFALRSPGGEYLGTLEVTQDATRLRGLTGERRLLQYEETPA